MALLLALFVFQAFGGSNDSDSVDVHSPDVHSPAVHSLDVQSQDIRSIASAFVNERLGVWQERMALKDWRIQVELVPPDQLEPKTLGNVHWDTDLKSATISVLSPEGYKLPQQAMLADMEVTIVHELVHLELASLPRSDASSRTEEHAVVAITTALLKLAPQH